MSTNKDGYATSWSTERESGWDLFRTLVQSGVDADKAAAKARIEH